MSWIQILTFSSALAVALVGRVSLTYLSQLRITTLKLEFLLYIFLQFLLSCWPFLFSYWMCLLITVSTHLLAVSTHLLAVSTHLLTVSTL